MATPKTSAELQTLLATLSTSYSVDIAHDGTWYVKNSSNAIVYRGTQREVWLWLNQQPTA